MVAVATEVAQQVVQPFGLGHKHGRANQCADMQFRGALQLEQVLGHEDADDVFTLALKHRKARVAGVYHLAQQGIDARPHIQKVHARGRHHHIARAHIGHADNAFKHQAGLGTNDVVVLGFGQRFYEFVGGVGAGVNEFGQLLQKTAFVFPVTGGARGGGLSRARGGCLAVVGVGGG